MFHMNRCVAITTVGRCDRTPIRFRLCYLHLAENRILLRIGWHLRYSAEVRTFSPAVLATALGG